MEIIRPLSQYLAAMLLAPLLPGVINRVKAFFGGRRGQPVLQLYFDLYKLLNKAPVYSRTATWVFRAGPVAVVSSLVAALLVLPFAGRPSFLSFSGDFILLLYLLGAARFATVLAALDTGSAFEGMGASREVQFAVFAEPAFFLGLAALASLTGGTSLAGMLGALTPAAWKAAVPVLGLLAAAFFLVLLAENSRVPADDPNTHLELTMIHEVMVLDHSGPDLAYILYAAALKLWVFCAIIAGLLLPHRDGGWTSDALLFTAAVLGLAALIGVVESVMARLRLRKVPHMLITAFAFSALALILRMAR